MYCSDCRFMTDLGRCRNGGTRRSDVGYFQKACAHFEPKAQPVPETPTTEKQETMEPNNNIEGKTCTKCGRVLPVTSFSKKSTSKDGLQSWCKECQNAASAEAHQRKKDDGTKPAPAASITRGNGKKATTPSSDPELLRTRSAIRTMVSPLLPKQEDLAELVHFASSQVLIAELAKRGWKGHLTYTTTADLNCEEEK